MKKVYIKYNPYKLETEILIDGKELKKNSSIRELTRNGSRLQEWIEDLPKSLCKECNDRAFDITFYGTEEDKSDLEEIFTEACKDKIVEGVKIDFEEGKSLKGKEEKIDKVFAEIQKGQFDELKSDDIKNAFKQAKNDDFEVCVVATMSAGKSTLINALLGTKLMPSTQAACTATITRIKDIDGQSNWRAEAYKCIRDKEGRVSELRLSETVEDLTNEKMVDWNKDEDILEIRVCGDIGFVSSDEVSLVLVDTPGPNNAIEKEHGIVQEEFLNKSSKALVLFILDENYGTESEKALLKSIGKKMAVNGKMSKDRFIFAVNKMDNRKEEDGPITDTLEDIRKYLDDCGIKNPNLFPIAALPALSIRMLKSGIELNEDQIEDLEDDASVKKLNRKLHLDEYATLPRNVKNIVNEKLKEAEENEKEKDRDERYDQALIHTGVPSLEAAICQYVEKYAKTAKIKNIVDTFMHRIDELKAEGELIDNIHKSLKNDKENFKKISSQIDGIYKKISDINTTKSFENRVEREAKRLENEASTKIEEILKEYQKKFSDQFKGLEDKEFTLSEAEEFTHSFESFAENLQPEFQSALNDTVTDMFVATNKELFNLYKEKLESLNEAELSVESENLKIDPLKLIGGSLREKLNNLENITVHSKEVQDGEEWVKNYDKKWYKPWTWFQESGYYRKKYKQVQYMKANEISQSYLTHIEKDVTENGNSVKIYLKEQSENILKTFKAEAEKLDQLLKTKLAKLTDLENESSNTEFQIRENEQKLMWLSGIQDKVSDILEI